jgi:hypothetical protein
MKPTPSLAYKDFDRWFLNANYSWQERKDGVPLELLAKLNPVEKQRAEEALISRLSTSDSWPARGLGYLRSQNALGRLRRLLPKADGSVRAAIALAIWQIDGDPQMADELVALSRSNYTDDSDSANTFTMIDIIYCLACLSSEATTKRLEELTQSKNYLISYNARRVIKLRNAGRL